MKTNTSQQTGKCPNWICPNSSPSYPSWLGFAAILVVSLLSFGSARAVDIYWGCTNVTGISSNWTLGTSWVGGVVPTDVDSAVVLSTNMGFTVYVDASTNVQDLTFNRAAVTGTAGPDDSGSGVNTTIAAGQTLSVLGANGFVIQHSPAYKATTINTFSGHALVVSNPVAKFVINSGQTGNNNASKNQTVNMAGLTNLTVTVGQFGAANPRLGGVEFAGAGAQTVKVTLAQTNVVTALFKSDYTQLDFTNSIEIARQDYSDSTAANFAQNSFYRLGFSNAFFADSIGIGRGNASGNNANLSVSDIGTAARAFMVSFNSANSTTPTSSAYFRNTNQVDRMSLLAIGVDAGNSLTNSRNNGQLNLIGGRVDMMVDQIWLGRNRTNALGNSDMGGFGFDNGTVDANTVIAGYMKFTNAAFCGGFILVGTNGTMKINDYLLLGHTPDDPLGDFAGFEAQTRGQVQINNGGAMYVKQVNVGERSTNNQLVVNGLLVVSNTIASSSKALDVLNVGATGQLKFKATPGVTNAFTASLVNAAGAKIGITEAPTQGETSYVVISYSGGGPLANSFSVGDLPVNIKGATISDDGANIIMTLSTNAPKSLVWRGTENSNWDHTSTNWFNPAGGTNCAFSDSDKVQFDDQSGVPTTINVTEAIYPSQVGYGIVMTNSTNAFVFASSGGSIQNASLLKAGTNSVQIDVSTTVGVTVNGGTLKGSGTVSSVLIASGASMNFAGTVSGALNTAGNATVASGGIVNGAVSVNTSGSLNNQGTLNGPLSMAAGTTVLNTGLMTAMGSTTIRTNCVFSNAGTLYGSTVTVDPGGTLVDTYAGSTGFSAGSINVAQLAVNGTFMPGGNVIQTTKVTDYNYSGVQLNPNGRVNLNQGSTTILRVNMDSGVTNTVLLSQNQGFGGSFNFKNFSGGTLQITNTGVAAFAAGQSFKFFGNYYNGLDCFNAGLNTTNTYPVIVPATPGPGLVWQLNELIPQGIIKVLSANDPSLKFSVTNNAYTFNDSGTNKIVNQLTWPEDKTNSWIQILNTSLTNGLSATNWVNLGQSALTNMPPNTYIVTNNVTGDSATFYRLVWP